MTASAEPGLKKTLTTLQLWGIAVGLVISGEYFGWSYGWASAGTLGFLVTSAFIALMYTTFIFSFTELTTSIPHAGGPFEYGRRAFGPVGGFVMGYATLIEFLFAPPAISLAIGSYLNVQFPALHPKLAAVAAYGVFMTLNILGVQVAATFELGVTLLAIFELLVFMGVVAPGFSLANFAKGGWAGQDALSSAAVPGMFAAIPFAIWFFLAIEGVAMAAEEAKDPKRSIPIAYIAGMLTLLVLAAGVMLFAGGAGDWARLSNINDPLPQAMKKIVGETSGWLHMLVWLGLFGLIASFHGIILGYSRQIFALARAGYLPALLGRVHPRFRTPHIAILAGGVVGLAAIFSDRWIAFGGQPLTANIVTMSVFGALVVYIASMASLFVLRTREPGLPRPFRAPLYPWFPGFALAAAVVCLATIVYYNLLIAGLFVGLGVLGSIYFACTRRQRARALAALSALVLAVTAGSALGRTPERAPYLDPAKPLETRIEDLLGRLTLEEKVGLVHANGKFRAGGAPRLGVPHLWTADGPQGVREELGVDSWTPAGWTTDFATAMPVGMALASTWNVELAEAYGRTVGDEARARGKHVILGPALNIQRTPLNGRSYDYFGEDPWLAGRMTVGYVKGMQAEQTIACLKHYAANNQEKDRGTIDVQVDERPLREIYLPAFEAGVREGGALAVMGGYNKVRGEHACHNDYLLNQILKREWGFAGAVISDWSGTHDTREAVLKGLDLEMGTGKPYDQYYLAGPFLAGLKNGTFPMSVLDDKVRRNLRMLIASGAIDGRRPGTINTKAHHDVARAVATEGIVLLKNQPAVLPLDVSKLKKIAVIGDNAVRRFAAGGFAAGVKAFHEITALDGILARVGGRADVVFSQGYRQPEPRRSGARDATGVGTSELTAASPEEAKELADRAVETARQADAVLFVGGLTHHAGGDDEGVDRRDLSLTAHQDQLIAQLVAANPRTAVVLIAGSPVDMTSWIAKTPAVLQAWYGGSEAGHALAAVVFGDVSPSGKLPCTFPKSLADSPAHAARKARQYPGEGGKVSYDEGLLVGYRWNDTKKIEPLFPFGHGLGYTRFKYAGLQSKLTAGDDGPNATLSLQVTNVGERESAEVVQAYVRPVKPPVMRPDKELKAFAKISLKPGETKVVALALGPRAFAHYAPEAKGWQIAKGRYELLVGASSRDIRLKGSVEVTKSTLLK